MVGECYKQWQDLVSNVLTMLQCQGVPSDAILQEPRIRIGSVGVFRPDIVVLAADKKSIVAIFEIKASKKSFCHESTKLYTALSSVNCIAPIYLVTCDKEFPQYKLFDASSHNLDNWIKLESRTVFVENYAESSVSAVRMEAARKASLVGAENKDFKRMTLWIFAIVSTVAAVSEFLFDYVFSLRLYALITMFYCFLASSTGFCVYMRLGDWEIQIMPEDGKKKTK